MRSPTGISASLSLCRCSACLHLFVSICITLGAADAKAVEPASRDAQREQSFFENRIRPVLDQHCYSCHSSEAKIVRGGLLVDSRRGLLRGGDSGPAIVPGNAEESLLIAALKHQSLEMPPKEKLPDSVVDDFAAWIQRGASDPRTEESVSPLHAIDSQASAGHWAFQVIDEPVVPDSESRWASHPIDAFVLDKLAGNGWHPAPAADKYTLIRRATFDLIGLPPSEREIAEFLADDSPSSFARVVDRLLASPHYGERWGRHWLDLVRYADTNGADENHSMPNAWRYRDWVFKMLNRDQPMDQFIIEQLAGDLLPGNVDEQTTSDRITATGMLVIGPKMLAEQDKEKMQIDIVDEQIDTVSRTMLGMTIACARCHDHKFDPISSADYYALAGIFASTRTMQNEDFVSKWMERDLPSKHIDETRRQQQTRIDHAEKERDGLVAKANQALLDQLGTANLPSKPDQQYPEATKRKIAETEKVLDDLRKAMPVYPSAMAVSESEPHDLAIHLRGNHLNKADTTTPRGAPRRLTDVVPMSPIPADSSGRLELARWMTSGDHPLTGRVMANRLWMWHFGQPLMRSPSNFGLQSQSPVHRELLDWLTRRLIDDGWSLKKMHRLIMSSRTYQMSSRSTTYQSSDPDNEFLWRQNRRRLEVEPLCDAIRRAGDSLDRQFNGPATDINSPRRAVYISINRAALLDLFSTFDYAETANHIEQRSVTTVPNQALFLLNNALVHQQAELLASRLLVSEVDDTARIRRLWIQLHGRPPTDEEIELSLRFIRQAMDTSPELGDQQNRAWTSLCRTLIAGSLFSYVD